MWYIFFYISESLKKSSSHLTDATIERHASMVGQIDNAIKNVFSEYCHASKTNDPDMSTDISLFVEHMVAENVFEHINNRSFKTFPNFRFSNLFKSPSRALGKMQELSKRLQKNRVVIG